jgi:Fe-S-cluster containining protein
MEHVLAGGIPDETDATCADCAMCSADITRRAGSDLFYNPETKCCTFTPTLPNFLVGRILRDDDALCAQGRLSVDARLGAGLAVTPLGVGPPLTFRSLYAATSTQAFGRSKTLRCPHYLEEGGGRCGIWKHRESVCTTFYCKHVRGAVGSKFWKSLQRLLLAVEQSLSEWCVVELDVGVEALGVLFGSNPSRTQNHQPDSLALDRKVDRRLYDRAWGTWSGREREFYGEAARLVDGLEWPDILAIGGPELRICDRLIRDAYAELTSKELPPFLTVGRMSVLPMGHESWRVTTYSATDPLACPRSLMAALPNFDGRSTVESMLLIEQREGIRLSAGLVRKLADFEMLIPGEAPPTD